MTLGKTSGEFSTLFTTPASYVKRGREMTTWKTMLEVARDLDVPKHVVKYHRQKLAESEVKVVDKTVYISSDGVETLRALLQEQDQTEDFETRVQNQLLELKNLVLALGQSPEKNLLEQIEDLRKNLLNTPESVLLLQNLERQSRGSLENEFYYFLLDYVERKRQLEDFRRE